MSVPDPAGGGQRPPARVTPAFYGVLAFAVICAVTTGVARTGAVAAVAFTGLVIAVFVLLNAVFGMPRRPRPTFWTRRGAPALGVDPRPSPGEADASDAGDAPDAAGNPSP